MRAILTATLLLCATAATAEPWRFPYTLGCYGVPKGQCPPGSIAESCLNGEIPISPQTAINKRATCEEHFSTLLIRDCTLPKAADREWCDEMRSRIPRALPGICQRYPKACPNLSLEPEPPPTGSPPYDERYLSHRSCTFDFSRSLEGQCVR
jgi:hypothetical protein